MEIIEISLLFLQFSLYLDLELGFIGGGDSLREITEITLLYLQFSFQLVLCLGL